MDIRAENNSSRAGESAELPEVQPAQKAESVQSLAKKRVWGFVDGFNLYHALTYFRRANTEEEKTKYQKYKWLCLSSLLKRFVDSNLEELTGVRYFSALPPWNSDKRFRHETYISALGTTGVVPVLGEFKLKRVLCAAACRQEFETYEEKRTDVNIATCMISTAEEFDKAILLTEDSDQVPAVELFKKLYPSKEIYVLAPIGRRSKDLEKVCSGRFQMDEEALKKCQLPNPLPIFAGGRQVSILVKPPSW